MFVNCAFFLTYQVAPRLTIAQNIQLQLEVTTYARDRHNMPRPLYLTLTF